MDRWGPPGAAPQRGRSGSTNYHRDPSPRVPSPQPQWRPLGRPRAARTQSYMPPRGPRVLPANPLTQLPQGAGWREHPEVRALRLQRLREDRRRGVQQHYTALSLRNGNKGTPVTSPATTPRAGRSACGTPGRRRPLYSPRGQSPRPQPPFGNGVAPAEQQPLQRQRRPPAEDGVPGYMRQTTAAVSRRRAQIGENGERARRSFSAHLSPRPQLSQRGSASVQTPPARSAARRPLQVYGWSPPRAADHTASPARSLRKQQAATETWADAEPGSALSDSPLEAQRGAMSPRSAQAAAEMIKRHSGLVVRADALLSAGSPAASRSELQGTPLRPGTRVVRGRDWKWQDQDGGEGQQGTVLRAEGGWVSVQWDATGRANSYRDGDGGRRDVRPVPVHGGKLRREMHDELEERLQDRRHGGIGATFPTSPTSPQRSRSGRMMCFLRLVGAGPDPLNLSLAADQPLSLISAQLPGPGVVRWAGAELRLSQTPVEAGLPCMHQPEDADAVLPNWAVVVLEFFPAQGAGELPAAPGDEVGPDDPECTHFEVRGEEGAMRLKLPHNSPLTALDGVLGSRQAVEWVRADGSAVTLDVSLTPRELGMGAGRAELVTLRVLPRRAEEDGCGAGDPDLALSGGAPDLAPAPAGHSDGLAHSGGSGGHSVEQYGSCSGWGALHASLEVADETEAQPAELDDVPNGEPPPQPHPYPRGCEDAAQGSGRWPQEPDEPGSGDWGEGGDEAV